MQENKFPTYFHTNPRKIPCNSQFSCSATWCDFIGYVVGGGGVFQNEKTMSIRGCDNFVGSDCEIR